MASVDSEFGLIERIRALAPPGRAVVGIGDDAAVLDGSCADEYLLATVDMQVEGVHFRRPGLSPFAIGQRAMAVNLSDIAAMGGSGSYALASVAIPLGTPISQVDDVMLGLIREASRFDVQLVGGNISRTDGPMCIDVTVLGRVAKDHVLLRSGAQAGDLLLVTGYLGQRAAARIAAESRLPERSDQRTWDNLAMPEPRLRWGADIAASGLAHAMMDLSDGLSGDIRRMTQASNVGAVIDESTLPISQLTTGLAELLNLPVKELALSGGEDYELLIAVPAENLVQIKQRVPDCPFHVVGEIRPASDGIRLRNQAEQLGPLPDRGWQHL